MIIETWYHGTDAESAARILRNGFCRPHNWFARTVKDAQAVGGPIVLAVEFEADDDFRDVQDKWQRCIHKPIPPERVYPVN